MGKKKGPPYEDDPECKYVVIEDPFPGHKTGKARDQMYWDWLGSWVYYMTGKEADPTAIYFVHTRDEVIVQLPEEFDITPILGFHVWQEVLSWGGARDKDRISYVFEYNYRIRGHPDKHGWEDAWPAGGEPKHPRFPVKFPYPRPHWATIRGRNCADLALPLPKSRERTVTPPPLPEPEPSLFRPYEAPAHLAHARNAHFDEELCSPEQEGTIPTNGMTVSDQLFVDKRDPYEEENAALQLVKQEPVGPLHVKAEPTVKLENCALGMEYKDDRPGRTRLGQVPPSMRAPSPPAAAPQPSAAFLAAFRRLEQSRSVQGQSMSAAASGSSGVNESRSNARNVQVQHTPTPDRARPGTIATASSSERARSGTWTPDPGTRVKPEPQEDMLPPPPPLQVPNPRRDDRLSAGSTGVKPEPRDAKIPPPSRRPERGVVRVKPEPEDCRVPPLAYGHSSESQDPRRQNKLPSFKRARREEDENTTKRTKTEY